jgi:hypothetical protein
LPLLRQQLLSFGRHSRRKPGGRIVKLSVKLIYFRPENLHLLSSIVIPAKSPYGLRDFFVINLPGYLHMDDYSVALKPRANMLFDHIDNAGGVASDLVARNIESIGDRDAFDIGGDLLQCVALGCFDGETYGIFARIPITHSVLAFSHDREQFRMGRSRHEQIP